MAERESLTIGQLVRDLSREFENLSVSKVRYLEEEGLLKPRRTKGGYRKFSSRDVERLRQILRLQNEHYLPLTVIKQRLREMERSGVRDAVQAAPQPDAELPLENENQLYHIEDAARMVDLQPAQLMELERFGLIAFVDGPGGKAVSSLHLEVVQVTRELERFGLQPRHLRMFSTTADRLAALFHQILTPMLRRGPEGQKQAVAALGDLVMLSSRLERLMLQRELKEYFPEL